MEASLAVDRLAPIETSGEIDTWMSDTLPTSKLLYSDLVSDVNAICPVSFEAAHECAEGKQYCKINFEEIDNPSVHYGVEKKDFSLYGNCELVCDIVCGKLSGKNYDTRIARYLCYNTLALPECYRSDRKWPIGHAVVLYNMPEDGIVLIDPTYKQFILHHLDDTNDPKRKKTSNELDDFIGSNALILTESNYESQIMTLSDFMNRKGCSAIKWKKHICNTKEYLASIWRKPTENDFYHIAKNHDYMGTQCTELEQQVHNILKRISKKAEIIDPSQISHDISAARDVCVSKTDLDRLYATLFLERELLKHGVQCEIYYKRLQTTIVDSHCNYLLVTDSIGDTRIIIDPNYTSLIQCPETFEAMTELDQKIEAIGVRIAREVSRFGLIAESVLRLSEESGVNYILDGYMLESVRDIYRNVWDNLSSYSKM